MLFYDLAIYGNISAVVRTLDGVGVDADDRHSRGCSIVACGFLQFQRLQLWLLFFFDQTSGHFRLDAAPLLNLS